MWLLRCVPLDDLCARAEPEYATVQRSGAKEREMGDPNEINGYNLYDNEIISEPEDEGDQAEEDEE
ncbi:hypothetical protein GCM10027091_01540 [Streptomyces daliensis]